MIAFVYLRALARLLRELERRLETNSRTDTYNPLRLPALLIPWSCATLPLWKGLGAKPGGLLSYGPSINGMYRRAAEYVDRIARGAKPSDLPIEQPTQIDEVKARRASDGNKWRTYAKVVRQATIGRIF
jgi:hypothetical protein